MKTLIDLESKLKTANSKVYILERERTVLLRRIEALEEEVLNLKTPKQIVKERKTRIDTLKKVSEETVEVPNDTSDQ